MKAIVIDEKNQLQWEELPDPTVKTDQVLLKVHYAALNRADLMQRAGSYPPPPGWPDIMGLEVSGEIIAMGEEAEKNSGFQVGDSVCALLGGGGYAQLCAVPWQLLMPVPRNCSMAEAAAIPEAFATAYLNLFWEGGMKSGDTLLMHAGASGLASVIIPMAKAFGARIITTVLSDEIADSIAHLGADLVVNTRKQRIAEVLKQELDQERGVDLAIDCLGGAEMGACLPYLKHGARWIMIATLAGDITEIDLRNIYVRNVRIIGSTLRSRPLSVKAEILKKLVSEIWPKVESGEVRPTIYRVLPVTQAEQAHQLLENGVNVGKVVLQIEGC